jgi:hypothetical protein
MAICDDGRGVLLWAFFLIGGGFLTLVAVAWMDYDMTTQAHLSVTAANMCIISSCTKADNSLANPFSGAAVHFHRLQCSVTQTTGKGGCSAGAYNAAIPSRFSGQASQPFNHLVTKVKTTKRGFGLVPTVKPCATLLR